MDNKEQIIKEQTIELEQKMKELEISEDYIQQMMGIYNLTRLEAMAAALQGW